MFGMKKPSETPAGYRKRKDAEGKYRHGYMPHVGQKELERGLRQGETAPVAVSPRPKGNWEGWNRQQERARARQIDAKEAAREKAKARGPRAL